MSLALNPKDFYEGSFADEKISKMIVNNEEKIVEIYVEGCETDNDKGGSVYYKNLHFKIVNWCKLKVYKTSPDTNLESLCADVNYDTLDEILIYNYKDEGLVLEGFGKKTGHWIKFSFIKPNINIEGENV